MAEKKEKKIGAVEHFYDKISVVAIKLSSALKVGDTIKIKGNSTDFTQKVDSMQIEHEKVAAAKKGDAIGIKVKEPAKAKDEVFKVAE